LRIFTLFPHHAEEMVGAAVFTAGAAALSASGAPSPDSAGITASELGKLKVENVRGRPREAISPNPLIDQVR
jgi:hypothetical protein